MMKNFDQSVKINHNPNWPYIFHYLYRILIIGGAGSGNTNVYIKITDQILIKFIYLSKIHSNESINCLLKEEKM